MLINRAVVQLIDQIANKTWEITDQESVTEIDVDWFGDFHRYSLFMNGGNSMSKKRKSRKQLKRELKFKTGCWKQSVKENHQLRGCIVELETELEEANTAIEKIRDTITELSHVGEPPPGLTRYVLSKKYPPFPDMSDDNKD